MPSPSHSGSGAPLEVIAEQLRVCGSLVRTLYEQSAAARWGVSFEQFVTIVAKSAASRFKPGLPTADELESYVSLLHLQDLALAAACAQGSEPAWEYFVENYRPYMRQAAAAVLKRPADSAEACELADALFGDLYGMKEEKLGRGSLLNYFHGRSKLSTWLRTVLAQRHIDAIRVGKRWESLDEPDGEGNARPETAKLATGPLTTPDPHRERYLALLAKALTQAIQSLEQQERWRLSEYYLRDKTLATIGRTLREHEATVSRKLERTRKELRARIETILRTGSVQANGAGPQSGLDEAQIALCFAYALEDWPADWSKALDATAPVKELVREPQKPSAQALPENS